MRLYGLVGKTLQHSFSKTYFTAKFADESLENCEFENFEIENIDQLPALVASFPHLKGLSITIPYKESVVPFLAEKNSIVEETGACNCIKICDGELHGYNTDAIGFQNSLKNYLLDHHTNALILGTGGAAKAVAFALRGINISYQFVSRQKISTDNLLYDQLNDELIKENLLIINTTPLGMFPHVNGFPDIPYPSLTEKHLLFDLTYNPAATMFMKKGEEHGAKVVNGYEMLLLQAEESWKIWNS